VGDERAETYLRLLAEAELRRAGEQLRELEVASAPPDWHNAGVAPFTTAENAEAKVVRAGRILLLAGLLDESYIDHVAAELHAGIMAQSRLLLDWDRRRGMPRSMRFAPLGDPQPASRPASQAMRVTPIGCVLRMASGRAPWALHLLSLVRTRTEAVITIGMRMSWPPDGSSTDLEITGAGPHHMPYEQLYAVDDQGTRYTVRLDAGQGGTAVWRGIARLSPVPPRGARRLDLIGDGACLIQLPLGPAVARSRGTKPPAAEPVAIPPGERLLVLAADRILASGLARGPVEGRDLAEMITVLTEAGAVAASSPLPGQLAALFHRLGVSGHGIAVPPAGEIPAQWASVIAQRRAPAADGPEVFVPLARVLPQVDGAQFALAGLSTAAGESHLYVIGSGMPEFAGRFAHDSTPGFSWWFRGGAGNWHVATEGDPCALGNGMQAFWRRRRLPRSRPRPKSWCPGRRRGSGQRYRSGNGALADLSPGTRAPRRASTGRARSGGVRENRRVRSRGFGHKFPISSSSVSANLARAAASFFGRCPVGHRSSLGW
jgi:hypothetical protein